jgi:hypothetical protein
VAGLLAGGRPAFALQTALLKRCARGEVLRAAEMMAAAAAHSEGQLTPSRDAGKQTQSMENCVLRSARSWRCQPGHGHLPAPCSRSCCRLAGLTDLVLRSDAPHLGAAAALTCSLTEDPPAVLTCGNLLFAAQRGTLQWWQRAFEMVVLALLAILTASATEGCNDWCRGVMVAHTHCNVWGRTIEFGPNRLEFLILSGLS